MTSGSSTALLACATALFFSGAAWSQPEPVSQCEEARQFQRDLDVHRGRLLQAYELSAGSTTTCDLARKYSEIFARLVQSVEANAAICGASMKTVEDWKASQGQHAKWATSLCETAREWRDPHRFRKGDFWNKQELDRMLPGR